jgi:predicted RNA-binding protein YlqC (UPF0109 family)
MQTENLVDHLVKSMVSEPDAVRVEAKAERDGTVYLVTVAAGDVGKMIGKNGRVISALRNVVGAVAAKGKKRAFVKVVTD